MARRHRRTSTRSADRLIYAMLMLLVQTALLVLHFIIHGIKVFWVNKGPAIKAWFAKRKK